MGFANWLQSCCIVFLWKNGSLGEFYILLMVDWSIIGLRLQKGLHMEKTMGLDSVGERARKCYWENQYWQ